MIWTVNKFTKKLRNPDAVTNNELMDYISHLPDMDEKVTTRKILSLSLLFPVDTFLLLPDSSPPSSIIIHWPLSCFSLPLSHSLSPSLSLYLLSHLLLIGFFSLSTCRSCTENSKSKDRSSTRIRHGRRNPPEEKTHFNPICWLWYFFDLLITIFFRFCWLRYFVDFLITIFCYH